MGSSRSSLPPLSGLEDGADLLKQRRHPRPGLPGRRLAQQLEELLLHPAMRLLRQPVQEAPRSAEHPEHELERGAEHPERLARERAQIEAHIEIGALLVLIVEDA